MRSVFALRAWDSSEFTDVWYKSVWELFKDEHAGWNLNLAIFGHYEWGFNGEKGKKERRSMQKEEK